MYKTVRFLLLNFSILIGACVFGQDVNTEFGQSRIQYKRFDWQYYSTQNFDVYFYKGGEDYAESAIGFLDDEFNRLTDVLGYAPYAKTKIFIYNSIHDLQQSNQGIEGATFTLGGQTDFIKLQMEVAYPGTSLGFRQDLVYQLSRTLIQDMMFGGSLAEIFQSAYLLTLPKWFIDGAARYLAYGWSAEMDDHIRDYLGEKKIKKLVKIDGDEASVVGQSIWNYIALIYGKSNISNILNLTRIIRNEQNSIASTLGVTYRGFLANWQNYYILTEEEILKDYVDPQNENLIVKKNSNEIKYNDVRISPSGTKIAYSQNYLGRYRVLVFDRETGKSKILFKSGFRLQGQQADFELPLLDWVDDQTLGVIYFKRGYLYISTIDVETGKKFVKPLDKFEQIKSFSFNDNGRLAVLSAVRNSQSDIYLISMRRSATRRITSDGYDDLNPAFIPGTAAVVFSSNRPSDSLEVADVQIEDLSDNFNLFIYDLDTTRASYFQLTNSYGSDSKPHPKNEYEIFYLSDKRGINNLYRYSFVDSTSYQVTNFSKSIKDYDLHYDEDGITFLMLDKGVDKVFYNNKIDFNTQLFTGQTPRQRFEQAKFVASRFDNTSLLKQDQESLEQKPKPKENPGDSISGLTPDLESLLFNDPKAKQDTSKTSGTGNEFIDTDNFVFEGEGDQGKNLESFRPNSFFSNYQKLQQETEVLGPIPYKPRFSFSNLITSFQIDPLRGFGIRLETQVTDILENHKLRAGALAITDLRSGDIFAEYQYLKHWVDLRARYDQELILVRNDAADFLVQRYALSTFTVGASFPLSNWLKFSIDPFLAFTSFRNLQFNAVSNNALGQTFAPDNKVTYLGVTGSLVFDNTVEKGFNILQGSRGKLEVKQYGAASDGNTSFGKISLDLRHYQKVDKEITFATRLFYGHFYGPNRQNFLLGGVPNWLFNQTEFTGEGDPLAVGNTIDNTNLLFVEYVTNVRGFDYNELFGNNALVFNAELRIPIFRYLSKGPISSNFLRNFQVVGFYDIGSAWTGPPPFSRDNSVNREFFEIEGSPFSAEISNFRNPWLAGFGFGLRTVLMGYYAKLDVARPIRDFEVGRYRFYVSVGLDF